MRGFRHVSLKVMDGGGPVVELGCGGVLFIIDGCTSGGVISDYYHYYFSCLKSLIDFCLSVEVSRL